MGDIIIPRMPEFEDSVTEWVEQIVRGESGEPQSQIVSRFLARLTALARTRIGGLRGDEDEADVALSALKSFLIRAPQQEFRDLPDRDALWSLLAAITLKKSISARRRMLAQKRDVRRVQSFDDVLTVDPSHEFLDSVVDEGNRLLESLDDPVLRDVARLRMEGYSNQEIAERIDRSVKTVERKMMLVRKILQDQCAGYE